MGYFPSIFGSGSAANLAVDALPLATYDKLQDLIDIYQSSSIISGFEMTGNPDGTINVAAGTFSIKTTNSDLGAIKTGDFAGASNVALTDVSTNFIYLEYNSGTPQIAVSLNVVNLNDEVVIGRIYRDGNATSILPTGQYFANYRSKDCLRSFEVDGFKLASGLIVSEIGVLNLAVTPGVFYCAHNRLTAGALDTSVSDKLTYWYGTNSKVLTQTQIDNAQYDNAGTLADLGVSKFGAHYVFVGFDGSLHVQYGTAIYNTVAGAISALPPTPPDFLRDFTVYRARIVIQKDAVVFSDLENIGKGA